jgi:hypothetical protein
MAAREPITGKGGDVLLYQSKDGRTTLDVRLEHESVWLTQKHMADLFAKNADTIGLHIRNIFKEKELLESATTEESSVVRMEGGRRVKRKIRDYILVVTGLLYRSDGTKRPADNALVALTLLIAESNPAEKDALIAVIVNLINRENL